MSTDLAPGAEPLSLVLHVDTAARDPLIWSGVGVVAFSAGKRIAAMSATILPSWPHAGEAEAVLQGLRFAAALGAREVTVYTDSESTAAVLETEGGRAWGQAFRRRWRRECRSFARCALVWQPRAENPAHPLARAGLPGEEP